MPEKGLPVAGMTMIPCSIRIVTLEGELINPGGSMTGGAFKNSSNLLSRRREIEEFEKTVQKLKQEMTEMELGCGSEYYFHLFIGIQSGLSDISSEDI